MISSISLYRWTKLHEVYHNVWLRCKTALLAEADAPSRPTSPLTSPEVHSDWTHKQQTTGERPQHKSGGLFCLDAARIFVDFHPGTFINCINLFARGTLPLQYAIGNCEYIPLHFSRSRHALVSPQGGARREVKGLSTPATMVQREPITRHSWSAFPSVSR